MQSIEYVRLRLLGKSIIWTCDRGYRYANCVGPCLGYDKMTWSVHFLACRDSFTRQNSYICQQLSYCKLYCKLISWWNTDGKKIINLKKLKYNKLKYNKLN